MHGKGPVRFDQCAVKLFCFAVPGLENVDVTRPTRDGGRDVLGQLAVGPPSDPIRLHFALQRRSATSLATPLSA
jgi:hypothetical protein